MDRSNSALPSFRGVHSHPGSLRVDLRFQHRQNCDVSPQYLLSCQAELQKCLSCTPGPAPRSSDFQPCLAKARLVDSASGSLPSGLAF